MKENFVKRLSLLCNPIKNEHTKMLSIRKNHTLKGGIISKPEQTVYNWQISCKFIQNISPISIIRLCKEHLGCLERPETRKQSSRGQPFIEQTKGLNELIQEEQGIARKKSNNIIKNLLARIHLPKIRIQSKEDIEPNNGKPRLVVTRGRVPMLIGEYQDNMNLQSYDFNKEKRLNSCTGQIRNTVRRIWQKSTNTSTLSGRTQNEISSKENSLIKLKTNHFDLPAPKERNKIAKIKSNHHQILRKNKKNMDALNAQKENTYEYACI